MNKTNLISEFSLARQNICRDFQRTSWGGEKRGEDGGKLL
jgi:hypothetical protein